VTRIVAIALVTAATAVAAPVSAQTYRLSTADGTVHFTNAPTDPRYQRLLGVVSGTDVGWLRLPGGDPNGYAIEIRGAADRYGVPARLVSAIIRVESAFNPRAISPKGARGLMQLMPETASVLGVRNMFDPYENIDGGVRHLRGLIDRFANNLPLAVAAYNAGEKAVTTYQGIPPFPETQDYVTRVLRLFDANGTSQGAEGSVIYRNVDADGTVVYTNIPQSGRR
jgi:hypothetical protein